MLKIHRNVLCGIILISKIIFILINFIFHKFHLHTGTPAGTDFIVLIIRVFYKKIPDERIRKEPE